MIAFHKDIIKIHKESEALKTGSIKFLLGSFKVISYGRFADDDKYVVALNNNYEEVELELPVWKIGITSDEKVVQLMMTTEEGYTTKTVEYEVIDNSIKVKMPKISSVVLKAVKK